MRGPRREVRAPHPTWLLDPWHKPVLTTLMAGVILAGGGAVGVKFVQAALAALTLVLIRAAARRFGAKERETLLAVALAGLAPFWVRGVASALTETSCALFLAAALYSWSRKWLVWSALAASFAFLARFDAVFFWAVWAPCLLRNRSCGGLACLAAGPVLWHLAGWAATGDAAYLLTHQPHPWGASHYGHGSWWTFLALLPVVAGALVLPAAAGLRRRRASPSPCARRWSRALGPLDRRHPRFRGTAALPRHDAPGPRHLRGLRAREVARSRPTGARRGRRARRDLRGLLPLEPLPGPAAARAVPRPSDRPLDGRSLCGR